MDQVGPDRGLAGWVPLRGNITKHFEGTRCGSVVHSEIIYSRCDSGSQVKDFES